MSYSTAVNPSLFATRDWFRGGQFFHDQGMGGMVSGWFENLLHTLLLLLLHQLYLISPGIRSQHLGTPVLQYHLLSYFKWRHVGYLEHNHNSICLDNSSFISVYQECLCRSCWYLKKNPMLSTFTYKTITYMNFSLYYLQLLNIHMNTNTHTHTHAHTPHTEPRATLCLNLKAMKIILI